MANTISLAHLYEGRINRQADSRLTRFKHLSSIDKHMFKSPPTVTELSKKEQLYALIRANPFIAQQEIAAELNLSRSAVAGYIASLVRERRLLGRAYVLPSDRPILCIGAANLDRKLRAAKPLVMGTSNPAGAVESFGGVARNIAENLARMGAAVSLITAVGNDSSGRALLAQLDTVGIDTRGALTLDDAASGTYTAVLDVDGQMAVALADMALYDRITPAFLALRRQQRATASLIVADLNLTHRRDSNAAAGRGAGRRRPRHRRRVRAEDEPAAGFAARRAPADPERRRTGRAPWPRIERRRRHWPAPAANCRRKARGRRRHPRRARRAVHERGRRGRTPGRAAGRGGRRHRRRRRLFRRLCCRCTAAAPTWRWPAAAACNWPRSPSAAVETVCPQPGARHPSAPSFKISDPSCTPSCCSPPKSPPHARPACPSSRSSRPSSRTACPTRKTCRPRARSSRSSATPAPCRPRSPSWTARSASASPKNSWKRSAPRPTRSRSAGATWPMCCRSACWAPPPSPRP